MEIKVAFTPPDKNVGMYHEKIGVLYDAEGNSIAFTGSMNETINAFHNNYESIVVFNSLVPEDSQRVKDLEHDFDSLWAGRESNITVIEFPEVVRDKLVSYQKDTINFDLDAIELEHSYEAFPISKRRQERGHCDPPDGTCLLPPDRRESFHESRQQQIPSEERRLKQSSIITALPMQTVRELQIAFGEAYQLRIGCRKVGR